MSAVKIATNAITAVIGEPGKRTNLQVWESLKASSRRARLDGDTGVARRDVDPGRVGQAVGCRGGGVPSQQRRWRSGVRHARHPGLLLVGLVPAQLRGAERGRD